MGVINALWISVIAIAEISSVAPSSYGCATQRPTTVLQRTQTSRVQVTRTCEG